MELLTVLTLNRSSLSVSCYSVRSKNGPDHCVKNPGNWIGKLEVSLSMMKLFRYSIKTLPITGSPIFINHIGIENEKAKVTRTIKDSAKKGDVDSCRILAKEVIRAKKAVNKLYASKAQLSSVEMSMKNQLATLRVSGSLQKSSEVMKYMQELVKLPEIQATMQELSKEMMKVRWFKIPEDCDI